MVSRVFDVSKIEDSEMLFRTVRKSYPDAFINGKPTAAIFMSKGGTSVDRDGGRDEAVILRKCRSRFKDYLAAVKIMAKQCRNSGTYVKPERSRKNPYHAEIFDSEEDDDVSLAKAILLARDCQIVSECSDVDNFTN